MALHDAFSRYLGLPLLRTQQALRPARRAVAQAAAEGLRQRRAMQHWDSPARELWLLQRLRDVVRQAQEESPYFRDLFSRIGFDANVDFSFADFARIPVLERQEVLQHRDDMVLGSADRAQLCIMASGGSTGEPVRVWVGPQEDGWGSSGREFYMRRVGVPPGVRMAYLWGHNLDPVAQKTTTERVMSFLNNEQWFDCFRLSPAILDAYHAELERTRPACIVAYASALGIMAEHLESRGLRPNYPRTCIVTGGEKLYPGHREAAERVFRRPVYERYGSRDAGLMAFQTDAQSLDYEVDWPNVLVEPDTEEAESAILITKLHADGMPMIRYRTGDVGLFPAGSRPGHPAYALHAVVGRSVDQLWLPTGECVHGHEFPHLLKDYPVREFVVEQNEDYSLEIKIVPNGAFLPVHRSAILDIVGKNLPGLPIELMTVDALPKTKAGKWRPVISRVSTSVRMRVN
jgi:phenylacetate-CoA ligase